MFIPSRSADNDGAAMCNAGAHVIEYRFGIGEINGDIDIAKKVSRESGTILVLGRGEHLQLMSALARHLFDERASFAMAEQEQVHGLLLDKGSRRSAISIRP